MYHNQQSRSFIQFFEVRTLLSYTVCTTMDKKSYGNDSCTTEFTTNKYYMRIHPVVNILFYYPLKNTREVILAIIHKQNRILVFSCMRNYTV